VTSSPSVARYATVNSSCLITFGSAGCEMNDLAIFMRRKLFQPARPGNANRYIVVLRS
jgi:hypothetical protein